MSKSTPSGVERDLRSSISAFKDRAVAVKDAYYTNRQDILNDPMTSDLSKQGHLAELAAATGSKLTGIKEEQESYVRGLRDKLERELRGNQPTDTNSVLLRRDAADRARRISDEAEALAVLNDAARGGDDTLAHAVAHRARQSGWIDATDAYQVAQPQSADSAVALAFVEGLATDIGYNLSNQITYADPAA